MLVRVCDLVLLYSSAFTRELQFEKHNQLSSALASFYLHLIYTILKYKDGAHVP